MNTPPNLPYQERNKTTKTIRRIYEKVGEKQAEALTIKSQRKICLKK
jgi:hypothetical protein